jgi:hypothetical protein
MLLVPYRMYGTDLVRIRGSIRYGYVPIEGTRTPHLYHWRLLLPTLSINCTFLLNAT